jgi:prepilin-type N-terminal cleavage/methylation domain-containing protein
MHRGFTIIEMMLVVAIAALMVALAYPSWQRVNDNINLRTAARAAQDTFTYAREQAVRTGRRHLVLSQTGAGLDVCGAAIPSPLMVLDDTDQDCCVDAGEPFWTPEELTDRGVQQTAFWGVTNAAFPVPEDGGLGGMTTGSTFTLLGGGASTGVAFRGDGIPVAFSNACALGNVGSGAGGYYITNGRPGLAAGDRRDLAVLVSPIGSSKAYTWDAARAMWTQ